MDESSQITKPAGHFFVSMCSLTNVAVDYWWISTREPDVGNCIGLPSQNLKTNWLRNWLQSRGVAAPIMEVCVAAWGVSHCCCSML